jgi:hypothetical protein
MLHPLHNEGFLEFQADFLPSKLTSFPQLLKKKIIIDLYRRAH